MSGDERPPLDPTGAESELDPYRRWDAAYVLGALAPAERREFEDHLSTCDDCRSEIAGIAGLPGLLAQMSPEDAAVLADGGELPPGRSTADLTTPASTDVLDLAPTTPASRVARATSRLL